MASHLPGTEHAFSDLEALAKGQLALPIPQPPKGQLLPGPREWIRD